MICWWKASQLSFWRIRFVRKFLVSFYFNIIIIQLWTVFVVWKLFLNLMIDCKSSNVAFKWCSCCIVFTVYKSNIILASNLGVFARSRHLIYEPILLKTIYTISKRNDLFFEMINLINLSSWLLTNIKFGAKVKSFRIIRTRT